MFKKIFRKKIKKGDFAKKMLTSMCVIYLNNHDASIDEMEAYMHIKENEVFKIAEISEKKQKKLKKELYLEYMLIWLTIDVADQMK